MDFAASFPHHLWPLPQRSTPGASHVYLAASCHKMTLGADRTILWQLFSGIRAYPCHKMAETPSRIILWQTNKKCHPRPQDFQCRAHRSAPAAFRGTYPPNYQCLTTSCLRKNAQATLHKSLTASIVSATSAAEAAAAACLQKLPFAALTSSLPQSGTSSLAR